MTSSGREERSSESSSSRTSSGIDLLSVLLFFIVSIFRVLLVFLFEHIFVVVFIFKAGIRVRYLCFDGIMFPEGDDRKDNEQDGSSAGYSNGSFERDLFIPDPDILFLTYGSAL